MPDTEILEQDEELEVGEGTEQQDGEPQTSLPDHASGEKALDRQALIDQTLNEGAEEVIIDELAEKQGDLTIEDLRKLPGSEDMTDEQIKAEWDKAVKAVGGQQAVDGQATGSQEATFKLPFPVYDANGQKIEALEKISVQDLFEGKIKLGYTASGKEQQKTLAEALRNASMGHWNEQKYNTTVQERNQVATRVGELEKQVEQSNVERKVWDAALTALSMGNIEPMKKLAQAYQAAITAMPQAAPGMISVDQVRAEQEQFAQGQRFINDTIVPAGLEIAKRYGADPKEVLGAIEHYIKQEPMQFLTKEKIESILQYDVPQLFEQNGYTASVQSAGQQQQAPSEVAELKKTVEALQARIASTANATTQKAREKTKKAPPAGGGATPGAGDSMPSFKSRSQMKAWMSNDPDWQKA